MSPLRVRQDIQLDVQRFGDPSADPVVLVAGAGAPMAFWPEAFCRSLVEAGHHVVRYSHRDTGHSTHFEESYPIVELLDDLMGLVSHVAPGGAHLVGHSMGGFLAQMGVCRYPDVVVSATSISAGSTVHPGLGEELGMSTVPDETWEVLMRNRPSGDFDRDLPGWLSSWRFLNGSRPFDEVAAARYTRALYEGDPRNAQVAENHVHAMTTVPRRLVEQLRSCTRPVLVIHGTDDPLVPADHGEATARLAPDSVFTELHGAGHMFFDDLAWDEIGAAVIAHTRGERPK